MRLPIQKSASFVSRWGQGYASVVLAVSLNQGAFEETRTMDKRRSPR